jgi:PPE-repeat protein
MWAQDVAAMAGYHVGASAAASQLEPFVLSLNQALLNSGLLPPVHSLASQLAAAMGFSPVTNPVASDPDLMSQTTNFGGGLSTTSLADPDDKNFVATSMSSPQLTFTATSGVEPTLGLGAPGQTILTLRSPVAPFLNGSTVIPFTDPVAPLFTALLPLGF